VRHVKRRRATAAALLAAGAAAACGGGASATPSSLHGIVRRGPTAPVCRVGSTCSKPAARALLLLTRAGRATVRVRTDARGRYRASLEPGSYRVTIPRREGVAITPARAVVRAGRTRRVDFAIDTGIR
jgi:carboxypeptidase family protein